MDAVREYALPKILGAAAAPVSYVASVHKGEALIRFNDLVLVRGPFKFYIPSKDNPIHIVNPEQVTQKWGGKWVEARFPTSAAGGFDAFDFDAVTVTNDGTSLVEWPLVTGGHCPSR